MPDLRGYSRHLYRNDIYKPEVVLELFIARAFIFQIRLQSAALLSA